MTKENFHPINERKNNFLKPVNKGDETKNAAVVSEKSNAEEDLLDDVELESINGGVTPLLPPRK